MEPRGCLRVLSRLGCGDLLCLCDESLQPDEEGSGTSFYALNRASVGAERITDSCDLSRELLTCIMHCQCHSLVGVSSFAMFRSV